MNTPHHKMANHDLESVVENEPELPIITHQVRHDDDPIADVRVSYVLPTYRLKAYM